MPTAMSERSNDFRGLWHLRGDPLSLEEAVEVAGRVVSTSEKHLKAGVL